MTSGELKVQRWCAECAAIQGENKENSNNKPTGNIERDLCAKCLLFITTTLPSTDKSKDDNEKQYDSKCADVLSLPKQSLYCHFSDPNMAHRKQHELDK